MGIGLTNFKVQSTTQSLNASSMPFGCVLLSLSSCNKEKKHSFDFEPDEFSYFRQACILLINNLIQERDALSGRIIEIDGVQKAQELPDKTEAKFALLPSLRVKNYPLSMNSLNNNLLLHRNYNPKTQLKPRKASQDIRELEGLIKKRMVIGKSEEKEKSRWYEPVLRSN